ncbi:hypothetical protein O9992_20400 [Vibrio lentus]|nr:hypothetical protein [Vibrio lentus]
MVELDEEAMFLFNQRRQANLTRLTTFSERPVPGIKANNNWLLSWRKEGWDKPMVLIDGQEVLDDFFLSATVHITDNTMTAVFDGNFGSARST